MINKKGKIKLLILIFIGMLITTVVVLSATTSESNTKSYDSSSKTVSIKDSYGELLTDITLNTPLNYKVPRGYQKVAEFTIDNKDSPKSISSVLDKLEFYNLNNNMNKFSRSFDYKYKTTVLKNIDDYETVCSEVSSENGTIQECSQVLKGTHQEEAFEWISLDSLDEIPTGKKTIGIFTNVEKGDYVEWIPTFLGIEVDEWASWTEDLNSGLVAYYKLDEEDTTGSGVIIDELSIYNGTNYQSQNASGKINTSYFFDELTSGGINITGFSENNSYSISAWVKPNRVNLLDYMYSFNSGFSNGLYYQDTPVFAFYDGSSSLSIPVGIDVENWYFSVLVKNETNYSLYLYHENGTNWQNSSTMNDININSILLGNRGDTSHPLNGSLDEIGFWNRTLTQSEITDLFNNGEGLQYGYSEENYTIILNLTDAGTGEQIDTSGPQVNVDISCDNGFNVPNVDNPYTANDFGNGVVECTFSNLDNYFDKTLEITADSNKTVEIAMSSSLGMTEEEHDWLEAVYECLIEGTGCAS